ncbi:hypothetical protein Poly30_08150 [Planctomycetes bacterium Poly30]|uniref:Uncharacterized protein n=2 Tax=Saltatorellus ferox TaxID=2528018 RepID=A0A518EMK1_9BACT|nr:hypothetical protein Poly30_08150 [Planctomycetes bacterium Poly30]
MDWERQRRMAATSQLAFSREPRSLLMAIDQPRIVRSQFYSKDGGSRTQDPLSDLAGNASA